MNCCDRCLILFLVFAFFQYQLRWDRDSVVASKPWTIVARHDKTSIIHPKQCYILPLSHRGSIGSPPFRVDGLSIVADGGQPVTVVVYANITAPPLSDHRITLLVGGVPFRDMTVHSSMVGRASNDMHVPVAIASSVSIEYCFDGVWDTSGHALVDVGVVLYPSHQSGVG